MKLGTRLTLLLAAPLVLLMGLFGYLDDRRTRRHLQIELVREGRAVARTVQLAMEDYFRERDLEEVRDLVDEITRYERIHGLRVFDAAGNVIYQSSSLVDHPFQHADSLRAVLANGRAIEYERWILGDPGISFLLPLSDAPGHRFGALQVLQLGSFIKDELEASRRSLALLTTVLVLAVVAVVYLITYFGIARPSEELVRRFREVGAGKLGSRVQGHSGDEFGRLALEFNAMAQRLEDAHRSLDSEQQRRRLAEEALRRAQRLANLGRLAAGLAHEVGTPLNVISGRVESLQHKLPAEESLQQNLRIVLGQIDRISRTVHGMLDFGRFHKPTLQALEVGPVVRAVLEFLEPRLERKAIAARVDIPEDLPAIHADRDQVSQVVLNLVLNAIDAVDRGGRLEISAGASVRAHPYLAERPPALYASIAVRDDGHGISPEHLDQVFDPFFTTKAIGEGAGLGLSISYGIVQEHGGWIEIASRGERGTLVTVHLPAASDREAAAGNGPAISMRG